MAAHWYVLVTEPNRDSRAAFYLDRDGFEVRCLKFRKTISRRRPRDGLREVFPGYIFVRDPGHRWKWALDTFSVVDVLRSGGNPEPLPPAAATELFKTIKTEKNGIAEIHMDGPATHRLVPTFLPDTPVRITEGTFEGLSAVFRKRRARDRVEVLLSLFGRSSSVELPEAIIEPIDD